MHQQESFCISGLSLSIAGAKFCSRKGVQETVNRRPHTYLVPFFAMNWESNAAAAAEMQGAGGDIWLPPGFRFHPTDDELIMFYLTRKVLNNKFSAHAIAEVDLNKYEPWQLPERAKMGEKEWYFFSLRDRKYPTGMRTNRATDAGYWKATGKDRDIYSSALVGMKKTLVFYRGRAPRGEKTNWVMHEYRLEGTTAYLYGSKASKEEWVVCRIFEKKGSKKNAEEEEQADSQSEMPSSPLPKLVNDSSEVVGPCFDLEDKNEAMYSRLQSNKRQLGSADSENRDFKMCKVEAMDNFKYDGGFDPFKTQFVVPQMQLNFPTEINSSLNDMCAGTPLELHLFTRFLSDPSLPSIELDQLYAY